MWINRLMKQLILILLVMSLQSVSNADLDKTLAGLNLSEQTKLANDLEELDRMDREERSWIFRPVEPSDPNNFGVPSNDQLGFFMSEADERWVFGGNRSGKTEVCVEDCDQFCRGVHPVRSLHREAPVKVRFCAPKWRDGIENVILQKFKEITQRDKLRGGSWQKAWVEKDHKLHYKNGSFINFKSGEEDLNTYGGADLDACYTDEMLPEAYYRENCARLTERNGFHVCGMTPEEGITWQDDHIGNPPLGVTVDHWFFSIYGNPYLSAEGVRKFAARLKDERIRETKLYGRFAALYGLVIPQFDRRISVIPDRTLHESAFRVFCIDLHPKVPAAAMWGAWEPSGDLIIYRTIKIKQSVPKWKDTIRAKSQGEKIQSWLGDEPDIGDGVDMRGRKSIIAEFNEGTDKLPICQVSKGAGTFNAGIFKLWDMFAGDPVSGKPRIFIFASCDYPTEHLEGKYHGSLVWELERYQFRKDQKADEEQLRERVRDRDDHYIADLRYMVLSEPSMARQSTKATIVLPSGHRSEITGVLRG